MGNWALGNHMVSTDSERGTSIVEFALLISLLAVLISGIFEFARGWSAYDDVAVSARDGVRFAVAVSETDAGVPGYADCAALTSFATRAADQPDSIAVTVEFFSADSDPAIDEPIADCSIATTTPPPAHVDDGGAVFTVRSGDRVRITAHSRFVPTTPVIGLFFRGTDLTSTELRTVYADSD